MHRLILACLIALVPTLGHGSDGLHRPKHHRKSGLSPEVQAPQVESGALVQPGATNPAVVSAPEGTAVHPPGATAPITCTPQNATSPACYSATQTARPIGR